MQLRNRLDREADFELYKDKVYKRPYLIDFLNKLINSFGVAIWASAGNDYVNSIISQLNFDVEFQFI